MVEENDLKYFFRTETYYIMPRFFYNDIAQNNILLYKFKTNNKMKTIIYFFSIIFLFEFSISQEIETKTFHLKDGSKVIGTIISENDSTFIVNTSYGEINVSKNNLVLEEVETSSETVNKILRDDLESDFVIGHTLYSQYHGGALGFILQSPILLLINGGSYFVASYVAKQSTRLSRIAIENSVMGHGNGIGQGFLLGMIPIIGEKGNSDVGVKIALTTSIIGGLGHAYYSYKFSTEKYLPEYQSYFNHLAERYSPVWLIGTIFILPDNGIEKVRDFVKDNPKFATTILLASSLSPHYWGEKIIGNRNMSLGDIMVSNEFHFSSLLSGVTLISFIEPNNIQTGAIIMLASSGLGWYYGINQNEGNHFTFEDGRYVSRMTLAGSIAGAGLSILMKVDKFKTFALLTTAGTWAGYFYGRSESIKSKNVGSNWDLKILPENYLLSSSLNHKNSIHPIHIPIVNFNLKF